MEPLLKPDRSTYSAQDFMAWRDAGTLVLTPKFQRRSVWTTPARSFLIDTLLRGMPVPPIYVRVIQAEDRKRSLKEIIDGQQRLLAVLDFIEGKYRLSRTLDAPWKGASFDTLSPEHQTHVVSYGFAAESFKGISDAQVLDIFSRLNTYAVQLNAQELRNGKFFGLFKQSVDDLARQHLQFWRLHKIFTERDFARMQEVEFTSELIIAALAGMQDKKKSIDAFYEDYDEAFAQRAVLEKRFGAVIDTINETFTDGLGDTQFRKTPLFYSLYCVIYHRMFGLPGQRVITPKRPLTVEARGQLRDAVLNLSAVLDEAKKDEAVAARYGRFIQASGSQTDNLQPRVFRFTELYRRAFE
ncbi:MAG: DUF262 domain-containing protein [Rhodoferax sp.]|nr:DUF262 domain-containing protein [Rhodoferax sp.]